MRNRLTSSRRRARFATVSILGVCLVAFLAGGVSLSQSTYPGADRGSNVDDDTFIESLAADWGRPVDALLPRLALAPACGTMLAPPEREHAIAATLATWSRELTSRGNG